MMTHGPPLGILDATTRGEHVGCNHLLRAARRCRPRLHCFGHIHEGWGAQRVKWRAGDDLDVKDEKHIVKSKIIKVDQQTMAKGRSAYVDISGGGEEVKFGEETLMVNASIMTKSYDPWNGPWLVDMDLKKASEA